MRYRNHLVAAAFAGLATAAFATGAVAEVKEDADALRALAIASGVTDEDAIYKLVNTGRNQLEQRGCVATDTIIGADAFELDGYRIGGCLPRGTEENLDAFRVLVHAAEATGQYRQNSYAFDRQFSNWIAIGDTSANWRIAGSGTWMGEDVDVRFDWDYRVPGVRLAITNADGSVDINVASDPRVSPTGRTGRYEQPELFGDGPIDGVVLAAWMEAPAGVYAGPSDMSPEELMVLAYLMPAGVILAGRDAADVIEVSTDALGRNVLTMAVPALGGANLVATLDTSNRPVHTQVDLGGKIYTADFGDFTNDRADMEVLGPHDIVIQVDGTTIADWELDYHHIGPYLVFPVPAEVAAN